MENRHDERRTNWAWLPILLIPVAFYLGWIASDVNTGSQSVNTSQPGVGGAPGVTVTVTPSPTLVPTVTGPLEVTPSYILTPTP